MKKYLCKIIAALLICSSMLALGGCFHYVEELYPLPKVRRDDIISITVMAKYKYTSGVKAPVTIPEEAYDMIVDYINSAVPYEGLIESEYKKHLYRVIKFDYLDKYTIDDYYQLVIFQRDGETFIEWNPDAVTYNFELCKVDNALFDLIEGYI